MRRARITEPYGYLIKPFVQQELHATIEIALQQTRLRVEQEHQATAIAQTLIRTQDQLSAVTLRLFEAQERERAETARDLHDDIGQRLALLEIDLEKLWQTFPAEIRNEHRLPFENAIRRAAEIAHRVRNVSYRLHPFMLDDLGLVVALRQLAEEFEQRYSIPTRFSTRDVPDHLPSDISVALYRVAQEALHNVGKHAAPDRVNVAFVGSPTSLELSIRDNGRGFDPKILAKPSGLGLISMAQRVAAVGGKLRVDSRPGEGTRIHVWLAPTRTEEDTAPSTREHRS